MTALAEPAITEAVVDTEWESLTSEGIEAAKHQDTAKWALGDIVSKVTGRYGENAIGKYAKAIDRNAQTLRGYERVSTFYPRGEHSRPEYENLSWSHYREAMRLGDGALEFLEKCSDEGWSTGRASIEITKRVGKPVPPRKLFEGSARVLGFPADYDVLLHGVGAVDLGGFVGRDVRLLIYEVSD